jgi:hypothetical protein
MSLLQEMETHGLADCEFNRQFFTPRELREAQTRALIEDIMTDPKPEDLPKIYQGLEHYFALNCNAEEIARQCKVRGNLGEGQA